MAETIKSNDIGWLGSSDVFYNEMNPGSLAENLADIVDNIHKAQGCVNNAEGLSPFICTITTADTEKLVENLRKFVYFCNGIHYEISEMVDTPFSTKMGNLTNDIIALDPSDYKYVESKFLFFDNYISLPDLIESSMEDSALKKSFDSLSTRLDDDVASVELKDSIKEANWWQEQFVMAEEIDRATDEFFTPEIRDKWDKMTVAERDKYIQEYKEIIDEIYFDGRCNVSTDVVYLEKYQDENGDWVKPGYGAAYKNPDNYIAVNINFKTNPEGMYSLDKLIDTMTHEMRHRYQELNTSNMSENMRNEWDLPYIAYKKNENNYRQYYNQPVEEDAKAFAALAHDDEW